MTYFPDLSPYEYFNNSHRKDSVNIGWLSHNFPFETFSPPSGLIAKLLLHYEVTFVQTRGLHNCELCGSNLISKQTSAATYRQEVIVRGLEGDEFTSPPQEYADVRLTANDQRLGSAEIRIFGLSGRIYCAPDLIIHYIQEHNYKPPDEFIEAINTCPLPDTPEYIDFFAKHDLGPSNIRGRFT